ncbi:MAG: hypothetical protein FIB06_14680 [Betaproteobacteria bacterium]|nr:hypothetical protein [Betaproteobacteria bacterium]
MKKAILTLLLVAMSTAATADLVIVGETADAVFYIDPTTIHKNGNFPRMWRLENQKQRNEDGRMSLLILSEYDCKEERSRTVSFSEYSESMASGRMLGSMSTPSSVWVNIAPGTANAALLRAACAR